MAGTCAVWTPTSPAWAPSRMVPGKSKRPQAGEAPGVSLRRRVVRGVRTGDRGQPFRTPNHYAGLDGRRHTNFLDKTVCRKEQFGLRIAPRCRGLQPFRIFGVGHSMCQMTCLYVCGRRELVPWPSQLFFGQNHLELDDHTSPQLESRRLNQVSQLSIVRLGRPTGRPPFLIVNARKGRIEGRLVWIAGQSDL